MGGADLMAIGIMKVVDALGWLALMQNRRWGMSDIAAIFTGCLGGGPVLVWGRSQVDRTTVCGCVSCNRNTVL